MAMLRCRLVYIDIAALDHVVESAHKVSTTEYVPKGTSLRFYGYQISDRGKAPPEPGNS